MFLDLLSVQVLAENSGKRLWLFDGGAPNASRCAPLYHSKEMAECWWDGYASKWLPKYGGLNKACQVHWHPKFDCDFQDSEPFATLQQMGLKPQVPAWIGTQHASYCFVRGYDSWFCLILRWGRNIPKRSVYVVGLPSNFHWRVCCFLLQVRRPLPSGRVARSTRGSAQHRIAFLWHWRTWGASLHPVQPLYHTYRDINVIVIATLPAGSFTCNRFPESQNLTAVLPFDVRGCIRLGSQISSISYQTTTPW